MFSRKENRKTKKLFLEYQNYSYVWAYNKKGQCISFYWKLKDDPTNRKSLVSEGKNLYFYNEDGTLAKVEEGIGKLFKETRYSYIKWPGWIVD